MTAATTHLECPEALDTDQSCCLRRKYVNWIANLAHEDASGKLSRGCVPDVRARFLLIVTIYGQYSAIHAYSWR